MFSSSYRQQRRHERQERNVRVKFLEEDLPPAEKPNLVDTTVLRDHRGEVLHVVSIPERGLIATASELSPGVNIFALDGDGEPLHDSSKVGRCKGRALAALGDDVFACGDENGSISTWCASSGARLEVMQLGDQGSATAMEPSGLGTFVVGTNSGALVFFSHRAGHDLHEVARGNVSHGDWITHIAVRGDAIVTASRDWTAAVWSAETRERVAVLRGYSGWVWCVAFCARFIAAGTGDGTIRLYEAGTGYALVRVLEGLHSRAVDQVCFVGEDMLMSASWDKTVAFTSLSSAKPVARLDAGFELRSASITPDARIACTGCPGSAVIFSPPTLVETAVKKHAAIVFTPNPSFTFAEKEPLQAAMVAVLEGSRSAGDACRTLFNKENCSRSISEWAYAHRLLMIAVASKDILGELSFEGEGNYWFENLYTQVRRLPMSPNVLKRVKECLFQAKKVGVIESTEAVLTAVFCSQDLSEEVTMLRDADQKILFIIFENMMANDAEMKKLFEKVAAMKRTQKLNTIFGFVFSFAPLGGNALAQMLVGLNHVWPLLDSTISLVVGMQGAFTPLVLDKFVRRSAAMIAPEGWACISRIDQARFIEAVQALGMTWEEFGALIQDAATERSTERARAIGDDGEETSSTRQAADDSEYASEVAGFSDFDISHFGYHVGVHSGELSDSRAGLAAGVTISICVVAIALYLRSLAETCRL